MARRFGRHGTALSGLISEFVRRHKVQCTIAAVVLAVVALITVAAMQISSRQKYEESFISVDDTIRIGIRTGVEGFGFIDENNTIAGFDRDVVEEVLRRLVEDPKIYEYIPLTSQNAGAAIKYGRVQIAAGQLADRTTQTSGFQLTIPYYTDRVVAVVPDTSRLDSITDLESGIGFLATSLSEAEASEKLENMGVDIPLTVYSDYESALTDLSHSRINTVLMPYSAARSLQQQGYRILAEPVYDINYSIMLPTGAEAVAKRMNRVLRDMLEDGTIAAIRARWNV